MSIYRDRNNYVEIEGVDYLRADVYEEIIDSIEAQVCDALSSMDKGVTWIEDAYYTIKALSKDLY